MIGVLFNTNEIEQIIGRTTKATTKGWKKALRRHKTNTERKGEDQLKNKDQHHTTLHSGQP